MIIHYASPSSHIRSTYFLHSSFDYLVSLLIHFIYSFLHLHIHFFIYIFISSPSIFIYSSTYSFLHLIYSFLHLPYSFLYLKYSLLHLPYSFLHLMHFFIFPHTSSHRTLVNDLARSPRLPGLQRNKVVHVTRFNTHHLQKTVLRTEV